MTYIIKSDWIIIRKHWIIILYKYIKLSVFLSLAFIFYYIGLKYRSVIWNDIIYYIFLPSILVLINYAFIKLILYYVRFYNNLLVIKNWQLIMIKSSLLFLDDIEFIDISKITKVDIFSKWFIPNIVWYWNLIVEQQRDQVKTFHFIPDVHKALHIIKGEKEKIIKKISK